MNQSTEAAPQWAIVELMGHGLTAGRISKDTTFGTAMLRVDVPTKDTFVTAFLNPSGIYRVTLAEEKIARAVAEQNQPRPVSEWTISQLLKRLAASGHLLPRIRRAPAPNSIRILPRVIAPALAAIALLLLPACKSTGGMDAAVPKGLNTKATHTIYLEGTPTFYDMPALAKALGPKVEIHGKVIDLRGGRISGKRLKQPKSRDDEDAVALRLRIPGLTLKNGIIDRIPGGIVCGADDCEFRNLIFTHIGEDAWSNNTDKSRNNRVINCTFIGDPGADKLAQWNDARDGLCQGNYFTAAITSVRVQESTSKEKNTVRFTAKNNEHVNVRTAYNVDGPKKSRTDITVSGDKYTNVIKRFVLRDRARLIQK